MVSRKILSLNYSPSHASRHATKCRPGGFHWYDAGLISAAILLSIIARFFSDAIYDISAPASAASKCQYHSPLTVTTSHRHVSSRASIGLRRRGLIGFHMHAMSLTTARAGQLSVIRYELPRHDVKSTRVFAFAANMMPGRFSRHAIFLHDERDITAGFVVIYYERGRRINSDVASVRHISPFT